VPAFLPALFFVAERVDGDFFDAALLVAVAIGFSYSRTRNIPKQVLFKT
jgi:hypothetical protein